MDNIYFFLSFLAGFFLVFVGIMIRLREKKKAKTIDKESDIIWENFKKKYDEQTKILEANYEKRKEQIEREIKEKENFNATLFKMREEEVDRLVEEKKKERIKSLDKEMENYKEKKQAHTDKELNEYLLNIQAQKKISEEELDEVKKVLDDFRSRCEAVNEAVLREKQIQEQEDFYRICVSKEDQEDIEALSAVAPRLRNKEALSKLIYDVFVKRPMNEMIKRITGGRDVCGIYKITYLKTGESYIGKSTNIGTRWQNHCKTALGVSGGAAKSTVHDHMGRNGIWNYSWEILEEVPKDKLSEREKFYIELYQTNKQLNMRIG